MSTYGWGPPMLRTEGVKICVFFGRHLWTAPSQTRFLDVHCLSSFVSLPLLLVSFLFLFSIIFHFLQGKYTYTFMQSKQWS